MLINMPYRLTTSDSEDDWRLSIINLEGCVPLYKLYNTRTKEYFVYSSPYIAERMLHCL